MGYGFLCDNLYYGFFNIFFVVVLSSNPVCLFIIIIISLYAFAVALMYFLHLKEKELMSLSS